MSCKECEKYQQEGKVAYIRWGIADVELCGCPRHLGEILQVLRDHQKAKLNIPHGP